VSLDWSRPPEKAYSFPLSYIDWCDANDLDRRLRENYDRYRYLVFSLEYYTQALENHAPARLRRFEDI